MLKLIFIYLTCSLVNAFDYEDYDYYYDYYDYYDYSDFDYYSDSEYYVCDGDFCVYDTIWTYFKKEMPIKGTKLVQMINDYADVCLKSALEECAPSLNIKVKFYRQGFMPSKTCSGCCHFCERMFRFKI